MEEQRDILTTLASHLILVVAPLREAFSDEEQFKGFLYRLGWDANGMPQEYLDLSVSVSNAIGSLEDLTDGEIGASDISSLVSTSKDLFERIQGISTAPPGVNAGEFLGEIGERLFELLLTDYLATNLTVIYNFFASLDIIEIENIGSTTHKHAYTRTKFKWSEIPNIFSDPLSVVKQVYGWGTAELDTQNIFAHVSGFLYGLGFSVDLVRPDEELILEYNAAEELNFSREPYGLKFPFYYNIIGDIPVELAIDILELPAVGGTLPGLVIQPRIPSEIPFTFQFGDEVDLLIKAGTDLGTRFGVLIRPEGIDIKYPFQGGTNFPSAGFGFTIDYHPPEPRVLIGSPDGIRLEMKGANMGLEIFSESGEFEIKALSEVKELALVLSAGNGDGFLSTILGDNDIKVDIPLGIDWSSKSGFGFRGSMNFEIALHPHLSLGFIEIPQFQLSAGVSQSDPEPQIEIEASINVNGNLGPLKVVVEEFGLGVYTKFKPGNLGPLDLDIGFKPPNGVGLSVDAGVVKGGGYLFFDFDKGEYAGALELTFSEIVSLKAIGLITTKMPDGSDGFSLIIIITAEFGTGIQLGFGFTLLGVGGLLGLNRTMRLDALAEGVRTGATESIMFPTNVVENAPKIISDLRNFFPVEVGKFLIGPMAKLGWGTPTLISISLGIIIEIPGNIAILGIIKIALPTEEAALIVLQVNFIGAIEFDKDRLWFFASMYDSRVLFITLEGEMGLLVGWGSDSNFVSAVGGFHPAFNPPPLPFPNPVRISINILNESWGRIRVMGYFAVTSNTAQFGASAELYFGMSSLNVEGHIGFDALFQFSPFYMIIQLSASLSVKVFGIGLFSVKIKMSLEGPSPWHAKGTGSISLLFFDIDVDFDFTWGEEKDTELPPITVMPLLVAEYEKQENWKALVPSNNSLFVSLREIDDLAELVLHPVGSLQVTQRAIPLQLTLNKLGTQKPDDANHFTLAPADNELSKINDVKEKFAIAQFVDLKDAEKLSSPSYQPIEGGIELSVAGEQLATGKSVKRHIRYELITIDSNYKRGATLFFKFITSIFNIFLRGNAVARSAGSYANLKKVQPFESKVIVQDAGYSAASTVDNTQFGGKSFGSQAQAMEFVKNQVGANPELEGALHVVPNHEINTAA